MTTHESSRRRFLAAAGVAVAVAPAHVTAAGAGDRLNVGIIGVGARGSSLMNRLRKQRTHTVAITAVCDVLPAHLARAYEATGKLAERYSDYRRLLEQKDLDAVVIATPPHRHAEQFIDSVRAGRAVYIEAPLSHTIEEAHAMARAAAEAAVPVQVGAQHRSAPHFIAAKAEIIDKGLLGKVSHVCSWWRWRHPGARRDEAPQGLDWGRFLGTAAPAAPDADRYWNWRYYWDTSGGILTDHGHHVCDWVHWFMGEDRPVSAAMSGGTYGIRHWEVPDTFAAVWEYADRWTAEFSVSYLSSFSHWHDHGTCLRGTDGALEISRAGWRFFSEAEKRVVKEGGASDMDGAHIENFLNGMAGGSVAPRATVRDAVHAVCTVHAANAAFRAGAKLRIEPDWTLTRSTPATS